MSAAEMGTLFRDLAGEDSKDGAKRWLPRSPRSEPWPWHVHPSAPTPGHAQPGSAGREQGAENPCECGTVSLLRRARMSCTRRGRGSDANKTAGQCKLLQEHPLAVLRVNPHFNPHVLKTGKLQVHLCSLRSFGEFFPVTKSACTEISRSVASAIVLSTAGATSTTKMLPWVSVQAGFRALTRSDCTETACANSSWRESSGGGLSVHPMLDPSSPTGCRREKEAGIQNY